MLLNAVNPANPTGAASIRMEAPASASVTPPQRRDETTVREAIAIANKAMLSLSNNLEFSLDPESGKMTVRVIDSETHEVIRQFPSEEMKAIARALDRMQGLLISCDA